MAVLQGAQCHMTHATSHTACVSHHCEVQLSPDLTMRYKISLPDNYDHNSNGECNECKINVQMLYDGLAWLGVGVSSDGNMVGGHTQSSASPASRDHNPTFWAEKVNNRSRTVNSESWKMPALILLTNRPSLNSQRPFWTRDGAQASRPEQ